MSVAVGFDFDHTLGLDNKLEHSVGRELFVEIAPNLDGDAAGTAIDRALAAYRNGDVELDDALAAEFARVAQTAAPAGLGTEFRARALAAVPSFVRPIPGACELLERLAENGVRLAILTNGWSPLQEAKAREIGFSYGPVIASGALGARKPGAEAFAALSLAFAGCVERWYVGDDPAIDVAGALAAGYRAVWFDWERRAYPAGVVAPSAVVHALSDLFALVMPP